MGNSWSVETYPYQAPSRPTQTPSTPKPAGSTSSSSSSNASFQTVQTALHQATLFTTFQIEIQCPSIPNTPIILKKEDQHHVSLSLPDRPNVAKLNKDAFDLSRAPSQDSAISLQSFVRSLNATDASDEVNVPTSLTLDVEPEMTFGFRFSLNSSEVSKTLTFVNVSNDDELNDLIYKAAKINPNIQNLENVSLVHPTPVSSVEENPLYSWKWNYQTPPSRNHGRNLMGFIDYSPSNNEFYPVLVFWFFTSPGIPIRQQHKPQHRTALSLQRPLHSHDSETTAPFSNTPTTPNILSPAINSPSMPSSHPFQSPQPQSPSMSAGHMSSAHSYGHGKSYSEAYSATSMLKEFGHSFHGFKEHIGGGMAREKSHASDSFASGPAKENSCIWPPAPLIPTQNPAEQDQLQDGPMFNSMTNQLERRTLCAKAAVKRTTKAADKYVEALGALVNAEKEFTDSLVGLLPPDCEMTEHIRRVSRFISSNVEAYISTINMNVANPMKHLYTSEIKKFEVAKKDYENEQNDWNTFLNKHLSLKTDGKKLSKSDNKYEVKKRMLQLKKYDYWRYLQNVSGENLSLPIAAFVEAKMSVLNSAGGQFQEEVQKEFDKVQNEIDELKRVKEAAGQVHIERRKVLAEKVASVSFIKDHERTESSASMPPLAPNVIPTTPVPVSISVTTSVANSISTSAPSTGNATAVENQLLAPLDDAGNISVSPALSQNTAFTNVTSNSGSNTSSAATGINNMIMNAAADSTQLMPQDTEAVDRPTFSTEEIVPSRRKEGFLFVGTVQTVVASVTPPPLAPKTSGTISMNGAPNSWKKTWCIVGRGQFHEISNWKKQFAPDQPHEAINLRFCTVREARKCDRRFCFELIGPHIGRRVYQALDEDDRKAWMTVIQNAIEGMLSGATSFVDLSSVSSDDESATDKNVAPSKNGPGKDNSERLIDVLRAIDSSNAVCADCGAKPAEWVSINLGCIVCIECSGIHRSLGVHVSKMRSLTLDYASFTEELVALLKIIGNKKSNSIWEARGPIPKPSPTSSREAKTQFIKSKYVEKAFADHSILHSSSISAASPSEWNNLNPNELLCLAVAENNHIAVLQALALGANVNAVNVKFVSSDDPAYVCPPVIHMALGYWDRKVIEPRTPNPDGEVTERESSSSQSSCDYKISSTPQHLRQPSNGGEEHSAFGSGNNQSRLIMAQLLLTNGANINAVHGQPGAISETWLANRFGFPSTEVAIAKLPGLIADNRSALHYAALLCDYAAIEYLKSKGADPDVRDSNNATVLDLFKLTVAWNQQSESESSSTQSIHQTETESGPARRKEETLSAAAALLMPDQDSRISGPFRHGPTSNSTGTSGQSRSKHTRSKSASMATPFTRSSFTKPSHHSNEFSALLTQTRTTSLNPNPSDKSSSTTKHPHRNKPFRAHSSILAMCEAAIAKLTPTNTGHD